MKQKGKDAARCTASFAFGCGLFESSYTSYKISPVRETS